MANCNKLFLDFEKSISITSAKEVKLKKAREALESRIKEFIKSESSLSLPRFYIQGSYKMRTLVKKQDGTYDIDLGVYFTEKPNLEPAKLQKLIFDSVKDHTTGGCSHKEKCIRVIYAGDHHVDLPIYYKEAADLNPNLATKSNGWKKSDPKELWLWFQAQKSGSPQLKRIIKYLKVWADRRPSSMPSGIAFTVWAARKFVENERDDISFYNTLKAIELESVLGVTCINPACPNDDLVSKMTDNQKVLFKESLKAIIKDAENAIQVDNQLDASKLWIKHLGLDFSEGLNEDVDRKEQLLKASATTVLSGKARLDNSGRIQENEGIIHQKHKNYGG